MSHPFLTNEQIAEWESLKGNMTTSPNYLDLISGISKVVMWYYKPSMWSNYRIPQSFNEEIMRHFHVEFYEIVNILLIAIFITFLRYMFEYKFCRVNLYKRESLSRFL